MTKAWAALKEIALFAIFGGAVVWSFDWSTHTIVWLIGWFLFFIIVCLAGAFKLMKDQFGSLTK